MNVARNILAHLVLASKVLLWRFLPPRGLGHRMHSETGP
jgi:hypothetical protein